MICRVCKRELDSPVCSFCGEDNTPYMNQEDSLVNNSDGILEESSVEPEDKPIEEKKKIRKYNIDYNKLMRLGVALVLMVLARAAL